MTHLGRAFARLPWLLIVAFVFMILFAGANSVDIFYFGLLKSEAFAFVAGFAAASACALTIAFRQMHWRIKLLIFLLVLAALAAIFNSILSLTNSTQLLVKPIVGSGDRESAASYFLVTGWILGILVGSGTANLLKSLRRTNLPNWASVALSSTVGSMVAIVGVSCILRSSLALPLAATLVGILIPLAIIVVSRSY